MKKLKEFFKIIKLSSCLYCLAGSAVLAFGLYNIHSFSGVTEGGMLGLTLLLYNCFGISPSVSGFVLNAACYIIGFRILGKEFAFYSVVAALGFSGFYAICEAFPPLFPGIAGLPFLAAILCAALVGPCRRRSHGRRCAGAVGVDKDAHRHTVGLPHKRPYRATAIVELYPVAQTYLLAAHRRDLRADNRPVPKVGACC